MVAITGPGEASISEALAILGPGCEAHCLYYLFVKPKSELPSPEVLKSKRIMCGLKPLNYPTLIQRMLNLNMIKIVDPDKGKTEN